MNEKHNIMHHSGITYKLPVTYLFQDSGLGVAEFAGRTAYDSFDKSENEEIKDLNNFIKNEEYKVQNGIEDIKDIKSSELLEKLAWVHFHHSVLEHIVLSYFFKETSRGVLQELSRHRIASYTIRSTRYTMSDILYGYIAFSITKDKNKLYDYYNKIDFLVTQKDYNNIEYNSIIEKLNYQNEMIYIRDLILTKKQKDLDFTNSTFEEIIKSLKSLPSKRNIGDPFKHIVSDNWSVEGMITINLRSAKNFFDLRDSGSAYFLMEELAKSMKKSTPVKYLKLIDKKYKDKSQDI